MNRDEVNRSVNECRSDSDLRFMNSGVPVSGCLASVMVPEKQFEPRIPIKIGDGTRSHYLHNECLE